MVPPKPAVFDAFHAPEGVEVQFVTFWRDRPLITPRSMFVHTNGASGEGSVTSAWNWAHAKPNSNTCPHYQVDRKHDGVWVRKMLPTDRRGIANATVDAYQEGRGDIATWSLAIETADLGWGAGKPGGACGFEAEQGEMVATIIAYESIVHGYPIELLTEWYGAGVASHTDPFTYPYTTLYKGKACPGQQKKLEVREWIIPRAREIRNAWVGGPIVIDPQPPAVFLPEEDDMTVITRWDGEPFDIEVSPPKPGTLQRVWRGISDEEARKLIGAGLAWDHRDDPLPLSLKGDFNAAAPQYQRVG